MLSNTRLYAAAIAGVSGAYALWRVAMAPELTAGGWAMGLVGLAAVVHGVVLVTPRADRLAGYSGVLMVGYAAIMLLLQALVGRMGAPAGAPGGMDGTPMMDPGTMARMGWDPGMVALALLMLASGLLMLRGDVSEPSGRM